MRKIEKRALELIAENYGFEHQLEKLREELREADGAITSFRQTTDTNCGVVRERALFEMMEEVGDVENMIYQFKSCLNEEELRKYKEMRAGKIVRQLKRIMEESGVKDE